MARAKYQVLILPYQRTGNRIRYCIFKRSDLPFWQFIAGGGEDADRSPLAAAMREAFEEAGIPESEKYAVLETRCSISAECFPAARRLWGAECLVIPEYAFAVEVPGGAVRLSHEHREFEWADYNTALQKLRYDSNKTALWELDQKIKMGLI